MAGDEKSIRIRRQGLGEEFCNRHILYAMLQADQIVTARFSKALDLLIHREAPGYLNLWDLVTVRQRQALVALAEGAPQDSPFREGVLRTFNMSQPAVMLRALRSLVDKDIVDKTGGGYEIVDLFFGSVNIRKTGDTALRYLTRGWGAFFLGRDKRRGTCRRKAQGKVIGSRIGAGRL